MISVEDAIIQFRHDVRAIIPKAGRTITATIGEIAILLGELKNQLEENAALKAENERLRAERDKAVEDLTYLGIKDDDGYSCDVCKYNKIKCRNGDECFEWRGLEESK